MATLGLAWLSACGGPAHVVESGAGATTADASAPGADGARPEGPLGAGDAATRTADASGQAASSDGTQGRGDPQVSDDAGSGGSAASAGRADSGATDGAQPTTSTDASAPDAGARTACTYPFEPAYEVCLAALTVAPNTALATQNTADGARGDCAVHASGPGGRNLYYRLTLPAGRDTRVAVTSIDQDASAVLRILGDCHADAAERGARGTKGGLAELCVHNMGTAEREVILAVGRYSGEAGDLTLSFNLALEALQPGQTCGW